MTAQEYLASIRALAREGRFREAREIGPRYSADVLPLLTTEEFVFITGVMDIVDGAAAALDAADEHAGVASSGPASPNR